VKRISLTLFLGVLLATPVFAQPSNPTITQLFAFACHSTSKTCPNGEEANSLIQSADGNFYGTTFFGGTGNQATGTVFKITPAGQLTTLYTFVADQNGKYPNGEGPTSLAEGNDGFLYGTTEMGGANRLGVVFKLSRTGTLQVLHSFCSATNCGDGASPSGLLLARDGNFYGAALAVIWRMTPKGVFTVVHTLDRPVEGHNVIGMTQASDGNFYGATTIQGFVSTLFRLTAGGQFTVLDTFRYPNFVASVPIQASNGKLYLGRALGDLFESNLLGGDSKEFKFQFGDALAYLTQASDANLWSIIIAGSRDFLNGAVVNITPNGKPLLVISFDGTNGTFPDAPLVQNSDGRFFGVTMEGGSVSQGDVASGVVFTLDAGLSAPKPAILIFNPSRGRAGTKVMIHGSHFVGTTSVTFNGVSATFQVLNTSNILATVPQAATTGRILVTNAGGTTASKKSFTVQ
jgi:uncharacterized repeat protein (TIGR03803 family)